MKNIASVYFRRRVAGLHPLSCVISMSIKDWWKTDRWVYKEFFKKQIFRKGSVSFLLKKYA